MSNARVSIDYEHNQNHQGRKFFIDQKIVLAGSGSANIVFNVPAGVFPHLVYSIGGNEAGITLKVYEGITSNDDGTLIEPYCANRYLNRESGLKNQIRLNSTNISISGALLLSDTQTGVGGATATRQAGNLTRENERTMAQTKYLFQVQNLSTGNNTVSYNFEWYENK